METCETVEILQQHGLRPPGTLTLAITGSCNILCCHCWVRAGGASSLAHVPLQTVRRLMAEFVALGGRGLRITGGEPLCHPQWPDILRDACSLGFKTVTLQTNASLLSDEHLEVLRVLDFPGFSIQISLDGVNAGTHDLVRGAGAFRDALLGIMKLVQGGFAQRISLFLTEMRHNIGEIPELLEFADRLGISSVATGAMVLCGRASDTSLVAPPDVEQYLALLERYDGDGRFRELYGKIGTVAALEWRAGRAIRDECCTFIENPYITPSGMIYPCLLCHTDKYAVSGVFEKGLVAVLAEGAPLWSDLLRISRCRNDEIPVCRECPWNPFCAGGCMGRAWGSYGDLLAVDDRCEARRTIYQQRCKSLY